MSAAVIQFPGSAPQTEPEAPTADDIQRAFLTLLDALHRGTLHPRTARLMTIEIIDDACRIEQCKGGAPCLPE